MDLTETQQKLADRIAALLAESPIDEWVKQELLDGLDHMPEHQLVQLVGFLSDQSRELSELEIELAALAKQHASEWKALEKDQEAMAMDIVNGAVADAEREGALEEDLSSALGSDEGLT